MWHHICIADEKDTITFQVLHFTQNRFKAMVLLKRECIRNPNKHVWIQSDPECFDRDVKQYKCPDCSHTMSSRELSANWDWGGPHCSECGCGGMTLFASVMENKPVQNGKGQTIAAAELLIKPSPKPEGR